MLRTYNGLFCTGDFMTKIESQDSCLGDDVSVLSDSDSHMLGLLEKADLLISGRQLLNIGWV